MIGMRVIAGSLLSVALASCAYFKVIPDNAEAFQAGLRCGMTEVEIKQSAEKNDMDNVRCGLSPSGDMKRGCGTGEGRVGYWLVFGDDGGLVSVQPSYIYDLTYQRNDPVIELCD